MKHKHGCDCHPYGAHAHDKDHQWPHQRTQPSGGTVGSGVSRNREHDEGLKREVAIWKDEIALSGGVVRQEYNSVQLARMLGEKLNGPISQFVKFQVAYDLGFEMHKGRIQVPDHRLVIEWPDGRIETKDLEHINEHTYRAGVSRAKSHSGIRVSIHGSNGRRVKDGPDVLEGLVSTRSHSTR